MASIIGVAQISPPADRVTSAIARAASANGVDFGYLLGQARIESGLNPEARARTSSATGLFQFTRQTWLATMDRHGPRQGLQWAADAIEKSPKGSYAVRDPAMREAILELRKDPEVASAMAAAFASDNEAYLEATTGREVEPVDLYLAHFLGPDGAARFLAAHRADPSAAAAPLLPQAAEANRGIFYTTAGSPRSLEDIRARFAARLSEPVLAGQGPAVRQHNREFAQQRANDFKQPMTLRAIEPMPQRLSIEFAKQSYQRLAALPEGRLA